MFLAGVQKLKAAGKGVHAFIVQRPGGGDVAGIGTRDIGLPSLLFDNGLLLSEPRTEALLLIKFWRDLGFVDLREVGWLFLEREDDAQFDSAVAPHELLAGVFENKFVSLREGNIKHDAGESGTASAATNHVCEGSIRRLKIPEECFPRPVIRDDGGLRKSATSESGVNMIARRSVVVMLGWEDCIPSLESPSYGTSALWTEPGIQEVVSTLVSRFQEYLTQYQ